MTIKNDVLTTNKKFEQFFGFEGESIKEAYDRINENRATIEIDYNSPVVRILMNWYNSFKEDKNE